jgi:uncharacterized zinc-type alcohol dehydrogenase-like protein
MRINGRFAHKLPEGLNPDTAGVLMCAGVTVWEPIMNHGGPGVRVGVISMGGLGHMAINLLKATGANITAISRGTSKKDRVLELGAHRYIDRTNADEMKAAACSLDFIIDTSPAVSEEVENLGPFMDMLVFGGSYIKVGVPPNLFQWHTIPLVFSGRKVRITSFFDFFFFFNFFLFKD